MAAAAHPHALPAPPPLPADQRLLTWPQRLQVQYRIMRWVNNSMRPFHFPGRPYNPNQGCIISSLLVEGIMGKPGSVALALADNETWRPFNPVVPRVAALNFYYEYTFYCRDPASYHRIWRRTGSSGHGDMADQYRKIWNNNPDKTRPCWAVLRASFERDSRYKHAPGNNDNHTEVKCIGILFPEGEADPRYPFRAGSTFYAVIFVSASLEHLGLPSDTVNGEKKLVKHVLGLSPGMSVAEI